MGIRRDFARIGQDLMGNVMVTYMIDLGRGANTPLLDIDACPSLRLRLAQSPHYIGIMW